MIELENNRLTLTPRLVATSEPAPPPASPPTAAEGWFPQLIGLGLLALAGLTLALTMPWKLSSYQVTQWLVFGEPTLALRALPSLLAERFVGFPASEADLFPVFLATLVALNLVMALAVWLMLRKAGSATVTAVGLFAFTGLWYLVNTALIPSTDPLMYLPVAVGLVLTLTLGNRRWLVPMLWLLAAVVLYVHPAGLFSAIPLLFAAPLLLRSRAEWSWRDLALFGASVAVVSLLAFGGRSLDPQLPVGAEAEARAMIDAEIAAVEARADFQTSKVNHTAAVNQYRSLGDVLAFTVYGQRDFYGVNFELPRWHFTIAAVVLFIGKLVLLGWLLPWQRLRTAIGQVWNPWQRALAAGAVLIPLPLVLLGTDYHRWLGFVDLNLTIVLLALLVAAREAGQAIEPNGAALQVVVGAFLFQILVAAAASQFGLG